MIASEARIAANRLNARKSTGPKTEAGKERSRANAVKHGLTGAGVAISPEEAEAVERRLAGLEAALRPTTELSRSLTRRAAILSVRMERAAVQEAAAISRNVRAAESDFDEAREAEVDALFEALKDDPAVAVRHLLRMPEGVDRMVAAWSDLRADLILGDGSRWTLDHTTMATLLSGRKPGGFGVSRFDALARAARGDGSLLGAEEGAGLSPEARRGWARRALAGLIDEAVRKLEAHRATLDLEAIAADRAGAADVALFDPSRAATLARKYEAAAEREFHRALREVRVLEAAAAKDQPAPPAPVPAPPLASFSPAPIPRPPAPPIPAEPSRFAPIEGSTYVPFTIGRPPTGAV